MMIRSFFPQTLAVNEGIFFGKAKLVVREPEPVVVRPMADRVSLKGRTGAVEPYARPITASPAMLSALSSDKDEVPSLALCSADGSDRFLFQYYAEHESDGPMISILHTDRDGHQTEYLIDPEKLGEEENSFIEQCALSAYQYFTYTQEDSLREQAHKGGMLSCLSIYINDHIDALRGDFEKPVSVVPEDEGMMTITRHDGKTCDGYWTFVETSKTIIPLPSHWPPPQPVSERIANLVSQNIASQTPFLTLPEDGREGWHDMFINAAQSTANGETSFDQRF